MQICSPMLLLPIYFFECFVCSTEVSELGVMLFISFCFHCLCSCGVFQQVLLLTPMSCRVSQIFSSSSLMLSGHRFKSLIHLELVSKRYKLELLIHTMVSWLYFTGMTYMSLRKTRLIHEWFIYQSKREKKLPLKVVKRK